MNTKFSLAMLASAAMARTRISGNQEFHDFIGTFGKSYGTVQEMNNRMQIWLENKNTVDNLNATNKGTGVTFGMNETSDLTESEFRQMQGLVIAFEAEKSADSSNNNGGSRRLQEDQSINWAEQGKVHPVKNQGGCGSCWAFAAATVQESMQAIKTEKPVVRLSEQEGVDCDASSYGCQGGWMSNYWQMSAEIGSQANETYKYEAQDGECRNQREKMIESRAKSSSIRMVDVADMKSELQNGPMSIAVAAGNDCWRYYESGILSEENNCPTGLDHGVVIIGLNDTGDKPYWIIQNSWGTGWGNNGYIWIAVEEGEGTSAMNTYVEVMDVEEGYPKRADPDDEDEEEEEEDEEDYDPEPEPLPEMCMIEEEFNEMGPGMCSDDTHCKGERVCSEYYYCVGYSNCADDKEEDCEDKCMIDETLFPLGPHMCELSAHCKGDRYCENGMCMGESNCKDDMTNKCEIDELFNVNGPNTCESDSECRGNRQCGSDGMCYGYCGCQ